MVSGDEQRSDSSASHGKFLWLVFLFLILLAALPYDGTFRTSWIYDDIEGIRENPALRSGNTLAQVIIGSPPDSTPYGRPLVSLSLALNRAASGFDSWSYRAFNLALHLGSAFLLFDLLRRVLRSRSRTAADRTEQIALWAALLFAVHPLATTVVTYTVRRAEGMMAFFYFGTLAVAARAIESPKNKLWPTLTALLCALGMASKETMATAPLAVMLMHRFCFAASWADVARRRGLYLSLAMTWSVLAACMVTWPRSQSVGFDGMGPVDYLNLQTGAWWHYALLIVAPWRSAIDYWPAPAPVGLAVARGLVFAAVYVVSICWAWRRSPSLGVFWVLPGLVLLPTSTVIPIFTSPVADHRMYLPVALGLAVAVAGIFAASSRRPWLAHMMLAACALGLAVGTVSANRVFLSERAVWEKAVAMDAGNARAWNNLGLALANAGQADQGEAKIKRALELNATYADAWHNLGTFQGRDGRLASAEESLRRALSLRPSSATAHCNLAVVLFRRGNKAGAVRHYEEAIRLRPDYPAANFNLAVLLMETGDYPQALSRALACLSGDPGYPKASQLVEDLKRLCER